MRFKPGDVVIKPTGGNKMTVYKSLNEGYECVWVVDKMHQDTFKEDDIVSIEEYKSRYLKIEEREDKINRILK